MPLLVIRTVLIALWDADMYIISSSFALGASSMGSFDKCCFSYLNSCSTSGVQWKSLFMMYLFNVLNSGKDFFAGLERNLFMLANFSLRLCTSLIVRGDGSRGYPSWILSQFVATDRGTPVMSDDCHVNISKFSLRNSSEDSVRTSARRGILFGTIPTTIPDTTRVITLPTTHTDTTVTPTEIPTVLPTVLPTIPPSPDYIHASPDYSPTLPNYSLASPDYSHASDTESDPSEDPSSDHIPPLPAISPFLSSADDTTYNDSARDSSSDSSSEASLDFHSDASFDSSPRHSLSDHSSWPSRKRRRYPMTSVPGLSPVSGALSPFRADLISSHMRVMDSGYFTDVEVDPKETNLKDDVMVRGSDEPHLEQDINPEIQAEINECFAYANALRDRWINARVVVEAVDQEESETGTNGPIEVKVERVTLPMMLEDTPEPTQEERAVKYTYETLESLEIEMEEMEIEMEMEVTEEMEMEEMGMEMAGKKEMEMEGMEKMEMELEIGIMA
nr:hypothetical protein [Tanacetum cinerariifolium]